jgi:hypothetical protein
VSSPDSPFCAELSASHEEPVGATASQVDRWILLEYRGLWSPDPLRGSMLDDAVKQHLRELLSRPRSRLLFIRRPRSHHHGLYCYTALTRERGPEMFVRRFEQHEDLVGLDLFRDDGGEPLNHPLFAVCTHGKRDRCCARFGRPLYDAVADQVDREWVWQCTHVGGDRFAGNLVCFPEGLYFGRVGLGDVWPLLDDYLAGRIYLDRYRGRCCYPFRVQAAEEAVRRATGLKGFDELELVEEGGGRVVFEAGGNRYEAQVSEELGEPTYATCNAERLTRPLRWSARLVGEP